ncbi:MAG: response regulator [Peptococcaceae bacterium]|nr:response regulator [Peptococcaceae bacterium]
MEKHKILVVDDEIVNLLLLKSLLKDFDVIEANDGGEALKKVAEEKPDLVLLDVVMPGMDGYTVLSIIKNSEKTRLTPVILVTALSGQDEKIKSLEKGADEFISKPFNPMELLARVKNLLRLKKMRDELENIRNLVVSIAMTWEARDEYSVNHSRKTSFYAEKLARKVFSTKAEHERIRLAGLLHDIGKIGIKDSILLKPGRLEPAELEVVKQHPVASERICSSVSAFELILPYIRHHHERYDGKGYPDGLEKNKIPLGARIIAVADAFDALTSERPYRRPYSQEKAVEILREGAGTQWDPHLVSWFYEIVEEDKNLISGLALRDFEQQYYFK